MIVNCDNCGLPFNRNPFRLARSPRHFCTRACFLDYYAKHGTGNQTATCAYCGAVATGIPAQRIARNERFYCDRACWRKAQKKRIIVPCAACGADVEAVPSRGYKNNIFFCNQACYHRWRSIYMVKDANPNWRGGIQAPRRDYGPSWRRQRKAALARDKHRCRRCGASRSDNGRNLDVHHRIPFRLFGYRRGENRNDLLANALSNLISLCRQCHWAKEAEDAIAVQLPIPLQLPEQ